METPIPSADRGDLHGQPAIADNVLASMESILQEHKFAKLEHLEFQLAVSPMPRAAEDMALMVAAMLKELHRKLPSAAKRGILSVCWV